MGLEGLPRVKVGLLLTALLHCAAPPSACARARNFFCTHSTAVDRCALFEPSKCENAAVLSLMQ